MSEWNQRYFFFPLSGKKNTALFFSRKIYVLFVAGKKPYFFQICRHPYIYQNCRFQMKKSDISTYFGQIWQSHAKIIKLRLISSKKCKFNAEIQNCSLIQPRLLRNSAEIKYCYSHKGMSEWSDELFTYDSTVTISLYEIRWKTLKLRK